MGVQLHTFLKLVLDAMSVQDNGPPTSPLEEGPVVPNEEEAGWAQVLD